MIIPRRFLAPAGIGLLLVLGASGAAPPPPLPGELPVAAGVRDPVFAILVGLVAEDLFGSLDQERLLREVERSGRRTRLPVEFLQEIHRDSLAGEAKARVVLTGAGGSYPVPYRVLLYHPGSFRASARTVLREWKVGTLHLDGRGAPDEPDRILLEDVRLWGLESGYLEMDVDGWLDALLGSRIDDTRVVGFALFRYRGSWVGMALGYNRKGRGRSGAFHFASDRILFPSPPEFRTAGSYLRGRLEKLMPAILARR